MPISQDQLAAFAAVVRAGSFTKAAEAMHLSQPALSRRITGLEERIEATLLVRGRAGTSLTEAGRRLLDFVEAQRALEEELVGDLESSPNRIAGSCGSPACRRSCHLWCYPRSRRFSATIPRCRSKSSASSIAV